MPAPQRRMPRVYQIEWSARRFSDHSRASSRPSPWGWASWPGTILVGGGWDAPERAAAVWADPPGAPGVAGLDPGPRATPPGKNDILSAMSPRVRRGRGAPSASASARHEGPLLGRSRVASRAGSQDRALRRQHLVRRGPLGGGHARRGRRRHRNPQAGQGAGQRRRGRTRARPPADQPHPLGPHPGAAVLRAAVPARQQDVGLRAQARRPAPAGGVRVADARPVFPRPVRGGRCRHRVQRADRLGEVLDRRRQGRVRAAQPPVHRDGVPPDRGRRVGRLRLRHRPVLRHPVRGRVRRAAAVAGRRAARQGPAEARAHARGRGTAVRGSGPGHLRHDVHARGLPAHPALRPLASRRTPSRSAARRARRAWRCSTTRPNAPTPRSTPSSPTRARPRTRRRSSWKWWPPTKGWTWSWGSA